MASGASNRLHANELVRLSASKKGGTTYYTLSIPKRFSDALALEPGSQAGIHLDMERGLLEVRINPSFADSTDNGNAEAEPVPNG
jgi:hypothetical protein